MRFQGTEVNLHTHTLFSHHGKGMPEDYLNAAGECGHIKVLGFSEHTPIADSSFPQERMRMNELGEYTQSVRALRSDILIFLGSECDWRKDFVSFYREELLGRWHFDYLLGSVHYLPDSNGDLKFVGKATNTDYSLTEYVNLYTAMLSSHLFLYGCHPDLFMAGRREWDKDALSASEDIIECALENDMPLEINGNGMRKKPLVLGDGTERYLYPVAPFWEMAWDRGVKIVTSSDAHKPQHVDIRSLSEEFAAPLGIKWAEYEIDPGERKIAIVQEMIPERDLPASSVLELSDPDSGA